MFSANRIVPIRLLSTVVATALLLSVSSYAQESSLMTSSTTIKPNTPEAFSYAPPLTELQHQQLIDRLLALRHQIAGSKPPVSPGPQVQVSVPSAPETKVVELQEDALSPTSPGDFVIGNNKSYTPVGDGRSSVAEPAIANSGAHWFGTMNWSRGYSNNAGGTWTAIADDAGPADAPFFCCDQDAVHDHGRDVSIWSELFVDSGLTTGVVRLHVRNLHNTADACTYDINGGAGVLYDYPHLGLGNNYIYLTTNTITNGSWTGATVWRYNLDQIASCVNAGGNVFNWTGSVGQVVWVPARSTTDTMYLVTIENGSQNRYFWWPENSNSIFWNVLNVESSNFGGATCVGGKSGNNWMGDTLSTSAIGFQVRTTVAQDNGQQYLATYYTVNANGTGRPQAYAAGTIVQTSNISSGGVLGFADIFNSGACFGFPDAASNARGDIGLVIGFGSSTSGGGAAQGYAGISDDYSRSGIRGYFQTVFLTAAADDNPSRYGDFLTARTQEPADLAFIGTNYGLLAGGVNVRMSEFLRRRYYTGWQQRHNIGN